MSIRYSGGDEEGEHHGPNSGRRGCSGGDSTSRELGRGRVSHGRYSELTLPPKKIWSSEFVQTSILRGATYGNVGNSL